MVLSRSSSYAIAVTGVAFLNLPFTVSGTRCKGSNVNRSNYSIETTKLNNAENLISL
jgi:hypothetical protein